MTREKAQERLYEIVWERDRLEEKITRIEQYIDKLVNEGQVLLLEYPTLLLRRPRAGTPSKF